MATAVLERSLGGSKIAPILKSPKRILVVEHDAAIRKVLHHLFSPEGYEVEVLPDVFPALDLLHPATACALILDVDKVGASRGDLLQRIAATRPGLPLVVMEFQPRYRGKGTFLRAGRGRLFDNPI